MDLQTHVASRTTPDSRPVDLATLAQRRSTPAQEPPGKASVTLLDVAVGEEAEPRLIRDAGRVRLVADVGVDGLDVEQPFPGARLTMVPPGEAGGRQGASDLEGFRPAGVGTAFIASPVAPTHQGPRSDGEVSRTIFGIDDRFLFHDTSFPWRTTGKVRTAGGWGSGTMIGRRHVLTASHVVNWDRDAAGDIGWVTFTPGYYDGRGPWGELAVDEVLAWDEVSGSLSDQETAFDYVVLVLRDAIGDTTGFAGYRTYDPAWNGGDFWQYVGYPGELAGGERPAYQGNVVVSTKQDFTLTLDGTVLNGSVLGHFDDFTPGQSGGAAWGWFGEDPWPSVIGVGSTIGSTATQPPHGSTNGDNEFGGGPALSQLIGWARANRP